MICPISGNECLEKQCIWWWTKVKFNDITYGEVSDCAINFIVLTLMKIKRSIK